MPVAQRHGRRVPPGALPDPRPSNLNDGVARLATAGVLKSGAPWGCGEAAPTPKPYVLPQRARKPLLVAPWTVQAMLPWGFFALPIVQSAYIASSELHPFSAWVAFLPFSMGFAIFLLLFLYPMKGTRAAVWLDGFRPGSIGWNHIEWFKRGFRSKVEWGEVEYVKVLVDKTTELESQLRVYLPGRDGFMFDIRLPDADFETEVALLILERWTMLGGPVDVEVWR
jgi:hypothetical protein